MGFRRGFIYISYILITTKTCKQFPLDTIEELFKELFQRQSFNASPYPKQILNRLTAMLKGYFLNMKIFINFHSEEKQKKEGNGQKRKIQNGDNNNRPRKKLKK